MVKDGEIKIYVYDKHMGMNRPLSDFIKSVISNLPDNKPSSIELELDISHFDARIKVCMEVRPKIK